MQAVVIHVHFMMCTSRTTLCLKWLPLIHRVVVIQVVVIQVVVIREACLWRYDVGRMKYGL